MIHGVLLLLFTLIGFLSSAQEAKTNVEVDKWRIEDSNYIGSGLDISADGKTLIIGHIQGFPLYFYNLESKKIERKIEIAGYYAGPKPSFSSNESFILLQQQFYMDYNPNRDREIQYEVIRVSVGEIFLKVEKAHSAAFTPDEKQLVTLEGADVCFYDLQSGKKTNSLKIDRLAYSLIVSPDGKSLVISHQPTVPDLQEIPSIRNHKKAIKPALKYRDLISVFDMETGKRTKLIQEVYDVIYHMEYSTDGKQLFVYARTHVKLKPQGTNEGYVNVLDASSWVPMPASFMTREVDADIADSPDGKHIAIVSKDRGWPQVHVYNTETNSIINLLDVSRYMAQRVAEREFGDGRTYLVWRSNSEIILLYGNHLLKWNPL